jgi:HAD superfamily hydrolase (TIGR01509 family)
MNFKKSHLLFDNDGVLVDTELLYYEASREALADLGVHLSLEVFQHSSLIKGESVLDHPETLKLNERQSRELRQRRNNLYAHKLEEGVSVLPGIRETLESLAGHFSMAIVTSCQREHFNLIHQRTNLLHFFDFVLVREDYVQSKPNPEAYLLALERFSCRAADALVIEDSPRGVAAARSAGIQSVAISHPMIDTSLLHAADRIVTHPGELIPLLMTTDFPG